MIGLEHFRLVSVPHVGSPKIEIEPLRIAHGQGSRAACRSSQDCHVPARVHLYYRYRLFICVIDVMVSHTLIKLDIEGRFVLTHLHFVNLSL